MMIIAVIDGMGGSIGAQIVSRLRQSFNDQVEILALGTNAAATQKMMRAHANQGATGENAICVSVGRADFILAPIGVVIPNAMMGEISPKIATAIYASDGYKLLLPISQPNAKIMGLSMENIASQIDESIQIIKESQESHRPQN